MTAVPEQPYDTDIAPAAALMADPTRAAILRSLLPDHKNKTAERAGLIRPPHASTLPGPEQGS